MYKFITFFLMAMALSKAFAQEFHFAKPPASASPQSFSSSSRAPTLTSEGFANQSTKAYQEQQAKVSALAAEQVKATQMNRAAQAVKTMPGAVSPASPAMESLTAPPETVKPEISATPAPAAAPPPQQPAAQPYTGFHSTPSSTTGGSSSTPSNNQNSGGWGSSIKY